MHVRCDQGTVELRLPDRLITLHSTGTIDVLVVLSQYRVQTILCSILGILIPDTWQLTLLSRTNVRLKLTGLCSRQTCDGIILCFVLSSPAPRHPSVVQPLVTGMPKICKCNLAVTKWWTLSYVGLQLRNGGLWGQEPPLSSKATPATVGVVSCDLSMTTTKRHVGVGPSFP